MGWGADVCKPMATWSHLRPPLPICARGEAGRGPEPPQSLPHLRPLALRQPLARVQSGTGAEPERDRCGAGAAASGGDGGAEGELHQQVDGDGKFQRSCSPRQFLPALWPLVVCEIPPEVPQ